jgi:hypothetical protein
MSRDEIVRRGIKQLNQELENLESNFKELEPSEINERLEAMKIEAFRIMKINLGGDYKPIRN